MPMTDPRKGIYPAGTPVGVASLDSDGRIASADAALSRILGYANSELVGKSLTDLVAPAHRQRLHEALASLATNGNEQALQLELLLDGSSVQVELRLQKVAGLSASLPILAVLIDVSERIRAEAILHDREERLRYALEAAQMGTFVWDVDSGRTEPDRQMRSLFGMDDGSTLSLDAHQLENIIPQDRKRYSAAVERACQADGDGVLQEDIRIRLPDNSIRWLAITGQVSFEGNRAKRMTGAVLDVTHRKRIEAALRESEERHAFLLRLSDALRAVSDPEQIQLVASRLLGERLSANRVAYAEIVDGVAVIHNDYTQGCPSITGRFPVNVYGSKLIEAWQRGETVVVDDVASDPQLADADFGAYRNAGVGAFIAVMLTKDSNSGAALGIHSMTPRRWTPAEIILAEEVAERTWSAMERTNAEAAQRQSEERLSQFTNASSDVLWMRDAATMEWEFLSPAFEKVYGIEREAILGDAQSNSWFDLIVPEDREDAWQNTEKARNGERVAFEYRIRRPSDGQIRWLRSTAFPMFDADGHVQRIGGINHDWTALKKAQEHQQLLTAELQHRVRNTLSVIRSIARRTAQTSETVEDYAMHLDGRIGAFARVQAAVTRDPTAGIDLGLLVADTLLAATARESDQVSIDGPQVGLQPKAAETMGLAIHELATNAVKYGALSVPEGKIAISWKIADDGDDRKLVFLWEESGLADLPKNPARTGFGTELVQRTLAYELDATIDRQFNPWGVRYLIKLPMVERTIKA
ncbi:MAG: PAS domain-containing protein [Rhizobiaceae bacterium]|nr:PAS domain-containing protein [Rhizobiaceae bacterium]